MTRSCEVVSSAKRRAFVFKRHFGRSLTYTKNSSGPRMEPCGTTHFIERSMNSIHLSGISGLGLVHKISVEKEQPVYSIEF